MPEDEATNFIISDVFTGTWHARTPAVRQIKKDTGGYLITVGTSARMHMQWRHVCMVTRNPSR